MTAVDTAGRHLAGELSADGLRWHSTAPLAAGTRYTVRVSIEDDDGAPGSRTLSFETAPAKKLLKVTFGPHAGTYGVGQPITAELSAPVKDKAARAIVERALKVRSTPSVTGSWYWVDDKNLHYRPQGVLAGPGHDRASAATWPASGSPRGCTGPPRSR